MLSRQRDSVNSTNKHASSLFLGGGGALAALRLTRRFTAGSQICEPCQPAALDSDLGLEVKADSYGRVAGSQTSLTIELFVYSVVVF